jgi:carbamoyltransferase
LKLVDVNEGTHDQLMYTLGINAVFHDSAACLIKDGILIAAAEEERFTHYKHGKRPIPFSTYELPFHAINYCLATAGIHLKDVDHIAYSFDPGLLIEEVYAGDPYTTIPFFPGQPIQQGERNPWENLFLSSILNAAGQLVDGYPHHLQERFAGSVTSDWQWHFTDHHLAHAASAYLPSPFSEAAVMTIDGRGEIATTTYNVGKDNRISRIGQVNMPHSLGLLYEKLTSYLGFLHSSDEYRVMALASYGKPTFLQQFREMISIGSNGSYTIRNEDFVALFGAARRPDEPFTEHHFDLAHSLQLILEESVLKICEWLHAETLCENLCLAGGVALNCVLNARIRDKGPFKNIWVQPASGDSGTALGAALYIDSRERSSSSKDFIMQDCYWGPEYGDDKIEDFLRRVKASYKKTDDIAGKTAELLSENKIVGWFQGRMEFGPRALGSRSILASPISADMQSRLNEVKDREDFRPVAPAVLEEDAAEWFQGALFSPFMLFIYDVIEDKADRIPAVKHIDGTARIQTVNANQHPLYYQLLLEFKKRTGVPVLINTSFNTLGKPIVCSPRDALECFWSSPFDALVIGSFIIEKIPSDENFSNYPNLQTTTSVS